MRFLIVALLAAISYAQTDVKFSSRRELQDCAVPSDCEVTTAQCNNLAPNGECGLDPDFARCCPEQCRVECGADPCTCSGLAPGTFDTSSTYGAECSSWDVTDASPFYDDCTSLESDVCGTNNWCIGEWCYVLDGAACTSASASSRFQGYYYSYGTCGTPDCYTCTLPEGGPCPTDNDGNDLCPYTPEALGIDCDGDYCPLFCEDNWVGDGQCDRRDGGYDCRNCAKFYNSGELPANEDDRDDPADGTFDCPRNEDGTIDEDALCDCDEPPATSVDPHYIAHNTMVIDGEMYCMDMIGVCTDLSFQANIATRDTSEGVDSNDYGTLRDRGIGRQGWFALSIVDGGDFHADLRSSRVNGDVEESHPIEYVVWGPFEATATSSSYDVARDTCQQKEFAEDGSFMFMSGSGMPAPLVQSSEELSDHTIDIDDVVSGQIYVLMISDKNENPGTTTLNAHAEDDDDATLSCDLLVDDTFSCQQKNVVDIRFTDQTKIVKHNLAGYWAEKEIDQLNDVPLGVYYSDVGTYTNPETDEVLELGLRVEALNPGAYRCAYGGNINNCAMVMTGLDTETTTANFQSEAKSMPQYAVDLTDIWGTPPAELLYSENEHLRGQPVRNHFGQINMLVGKAELRFTVVIDDPENEVALPNYREGVENTEPWDRIKLSIFDIDSKMAEGETVEIVNAHKICPGGVVKTDESYPYYLNSQNYDYLDYSQNDFQSASGYRWDIFSGCWVRRSTEAGDSIFTVANQPNCVEYPGNDMTEDDKCKDNNPAGPGDLIHMQKLMSVEAEFTNVGSEGMQVNFIVSRDHQQSRNLWFGGESVSIGRKCCKDVVQCDHGYINGDLECTDVTGDDSECTVENCCNNPPSSHGDPIIHTFHGDCYDLHKDGNYLATAHPAWEHQVHVAVYNDYMRQISITDLNGDVLLSVNNFGEVLNNGWVGYLKVQTIQCPEDYAKDDCVGEYTNVSFDAQDLYFDVRVGMRHNYRDQALKFGETGHHMDIFPQPYYKRFNPRRSEYSGLYFYNPLPEELPQCTY